MRFVMYPVVTLYFFLLSFAKPAAAQVTLYQSNPVGLLSKERLLLEVRFAPSHAVMLGHSFYYGYCPGWQSMGVYRYYAKKSGQTELFYYAKVGYGNGRENAISLKRDDTAPFDYALAGGGIGFQVSMGKNQRWLFDLSGGLKAFGLFNTTTRRDDFDLFYITGPGSIVDINAHFGFRLFSGSTR